MLDKSGAQITSAAAAVAAQLQQLVAAAPPTRSRREVEGLALWSHAWLPMLWTYGWTITAFSIYVGGGFFKYPTTVNAFSWGMQISLYALLLSPAVIWLAARWMRDSVLARIVLGELILIGTLGFVIGAGLLAVRGNSELGSAPIQTSQVELHGREIKRRRRGQDYYLLFEPFVPGFDEPAKVKVGGDTYRSADGSSSFQLRWRIGAFGQPVVVEAPKPLN